MDVIKGIRLKTYRDKQGARRYTVEVTSNNKVWTRYTTMGQPIILTDEESTLLTMADILRRFSKKVRV